MYKSSLRVAYKEVFRVKYKGYIRVLYKDKYRVVRVIYTINLSVIQKDELRFHFVKPDSKSMVG